MKQNKRIAGLYFRLSQEDERVGESLSIDNQRHILRKYAEENEFEIHDEYIDDGVSGTTFDRPEIQRLLDDAKTGVIDTIIVKDLSRFGRNYIEVGQYLDYASAEQNPPLEEAVVKEINFTVNLQELDTNYIYVMYKASTSGTWFWATSDTWVNDEIYYEIMGIKDESDRDAPEFYWSYQDPF